MRSGEIDTLIVDSGATADQREMLTQPDVRLCGGGRSRGISTMSTATLDRTLIERLVRDALTSRSATATPCERQGGNAEPGRQRLGAALSRHAGRPRTTVRQRPQTDAATRQLYQDGFFAAEESVTIIGPRHRLITNLRILGPCRDYSQVELAFTDAVMLGLELPVRKSGDHRDSPGAISWGRRASSNWKKA